jgi:hypothetical protein
MAFEQGLEGYVRLSTGETVGRIFQKESKNSETKFGGIFLS